MPKKVSLIFCKNTVKICRYMIVGGRKETLKQDFSSLEILQEG